MISYSLCKDTTQPKTTQKSAAGEEIKAWDGQKLSSQELRENERRAANIESGCLGHKSETHLYLLTQREVSPVPPLHSVRKRKRE